MQFSFATKVKSSVGTSAYCEENDSWDTLSIFVGEFFSRNCYQVTYFTEETE